MNLSHEESNSIAVFDQFSRLQTLRMNRKVHTGDNKNPSQEMLSTDVYDIDVDTVVEQLLAEQFTSRTPISTLPTSTSVVTSAVANDLKGRNNSVQQAQQRDVSISSTSHSSNLN